MIRSTTLFSLVATLALPFALTAACVEPSPADADDQAVSVGDEDGLDTEGAVGTAEQALIACPWGQFPFRRSVDFKYNFGGKSYVFKINYDDTKNTIKYSNTSTDGTVNGNGVVNHWNRCPASNENVVLTRSDGWKQTCIHVCLPDGREELHCPAGQYVMTITAQNDVCASLPRTFAQKNDAAGRGVECKIARGAVHDECMNAFKTGGCQNTCEVCWDMHCYLPDEPSDEGFQDCVGTRDPDYYVDDNGTVINGPLPGGYCYDNPLAYEMPDADDPCIAPTGYSFTSWCDPWVF